MCVHPFEIIVCRAVHLHEMAGICYGAIKGGIYRRVCWLQRHPKHFDRSEQLANYLDRALASRPSHFSTPATASSVSAWFSLP